MGKESATHTHTCIYGMVEYYSAPRKKQMLPFEATWTDLENIMLSEISQMEKVKYILQGITYIWN